ncbi:GNAT family N-acetyltransferase [Loigolactobacillus jiayinensis]|uniref:GNAT family N-acetyltransferase n=1 Tax=Loigolactobacillus jiayinensis TaxID=2486016 RepID=A0ABW1RCW7_9LACO|nr:GNAT family N-acetyltransferase [Loigolactobacillus jiayinensis]
MQIRHVMPSDLSQLIEIEKAGFSPAKAATATAFKTRIATISDTFLVATEHEQVIGFINGPVMQHLYLTDDLFTTTQPNPLAGGYQSVLGLAVAPSWRHHGVAQRLLTELAQIARHQQRQAVTLTCEQRLIPFYELAGFHNDGQSSSTHGDVIWYNMVQTLV